MSASQRISDGKYGGGMVSTIRLGDDDEMAYFVSKNPCFPKVN